MAKGSSKQQFRPVIFFRGIEQRGQRRMMRVQSIIFVAA
jgi:hypothetical protein